jgi:hypothetical protein
MICGIIACTIVLFSTIGTACFICGLTTNSQKAANGDNEAINNIVNDVTEEIVDELQWTIYATVAIAVLKIFAIIGIPVGVIVAALKK